MGKLILITGGARSGKSSFAQELAVQSGDSVLFTATAEALDDEMRLRITEHRKSRPAGWRTLEAPSDTGKLIKANAKGVKTVIIDCVTLLLNAVFNRYCNGERINLPEIENGADKEINGLLDCITDTPALFIVVTNEVGMGIVPDNEAARIYRDLLGKANRLLAQQAEEVYLMVSGIPVKIK